MGDFHEIVGDLTREQLNSDPYQCGVHVGKVARERDPRSWPQKLARSVGVRVWSCGRKLFGGVRLGDSGLTRDGVLVYGRNSRLFDIFVYPSLDREVEWRAVALLLGLALVSPSRGDREGVVVRSDCVNGLFAEGFADGFLRGDGCVESSGIGSGRAVAARDSVSRPAARPDSVLSLNGHTVKVYNCDGVPLSTVIDGRSVSLVNERTGERVRVPTRASHVFFVGGVVLFHYPNWGEPDLVFDDGWVGRNWFPACGCCGAPVVVDGDVCDACNNNEFLCW